MATKDWVTANWIKQRADKHKFDPKFIVFARKLALMGCNRVEIAHNLGADRYTFNEWVHCFPEFANAIDEGKMLSQFEVVDALYKRCVGFKVKKTTTYRNGDTSVTEEFVVPDVPAIRYWLENRCGRHWKAQIAIAEAAPNSNELNARVVEYPRKDAEAAERPATGPVTVPARDVSSSESG